MTKTFRLVSHLFPLILCVFIVAPQFVLGQKHSSFVLNNFAIGRQAGNYTEEGSYIMPHVIRADDGSYIMYFTNNGPHHTEIVRAVSSDGFSWTVTGTALSGVDDPTDREFRVGGASIVRLKDGAYRMYYRAAPDNKNGEPPKYHIKSAISQDGVNFERESGVRIENVYHDSDSPFLLAAHGSFFRAKNGTFVAIFSANTLEDRGPSDLVIGYSRDGLKWSRFKTLYKDCHDPVVVLVDGRFHLYTMFIDQKNVMAVSRNGLQWPKRLRTFKLTDEDGNQLDPTTDHGAGDFAAVADDNDSLIFYSNFGVPSSDIVAYKERE